VQEQGNLHIAKFWEDAFKVLKNALKLATEQVYGQQQFFTGMFIFLF